MLSKKNWISKGLVCILLMLPTLAFTYQASAKVLKCSWFDTYIYSNGADIELYSESVTFADAKITARVPKLQFETQFTGRLNSGTTESICNCDGVFDAEYSIELFKDRNEYLRTDIAVKKRRITSVSFDEQKWFTHMNRVCRRYVRFLVESGPTGFQKMLWEYSERKGEKVENGVFYDLQETFKPKYTCEKPFDYLTNAKNHFGEHWRGTDSENDMVRLKDMPSFCKKTCVELQAEYSVPCKISDFP